MAYFTDDFAKFFSELEENNHKEWFDENRKRYENEVKKPFQKLVKDLIEKTSEFDEVGMLEPKHCIFRINRDVRFSKDKRPYKNNVSAVIGPGGKKNKTYPSSYFELTKNGVGYYGGVYGPTKEELYTIRWNMMQAPDEINQIISTKAFKKRFKGIEGDRNKVLPKEFKEAAETQPILYQKQLYTYSTLPKELLTSEKLADEIVAIFKDNMPFLEYLRRSID